MRSTDFLTDADYIPKGPNWIRIDDIDYWQETLPSLATRRWAPTARHTGRTRIPAITGAPGAVRAVDCESLQEGNVAVVLLARRDIVDLVEQPPAVKYFDKVEQCWREHTFDFLATMANGWKIAIANRPQKRSEEVERIIKAIAEQGCTLADAYTVVTDADLPKNLIRNAELILAVRRDHDRSADKKIRDIVGTLNGAVTIETLVTASGLAGKGFRAVVRLIDEGEIEIERNIMIDFPALVRHSASRRGNQ